MVKIATSLMFGSALGLAFAAPHPDSSLGDEVAVSAPNGTPITDTAELASQTAAEASMYMNTYTMTSAAAAMYTSVASSMMDDSSSMMDDSMSTMMDVSTMMDDSTMMDATSTMMSDATSTMAYESSSTVSVSYGSGSSSWSNSGYNDCVQQCIASFGAPMGTYVPPPPSSTVSSDDGSYSGSVGTGATHTIIVAPSQGVLRYVPFATNASVGDTIQFVWHANMHTVTKSSELELCNKTSDAPFTSGVQNESFVFTQMVNTTDPTFFYCGVPTHCQKGMFGIINPPSALTANTSVSSMMPSMVSNSSDMAVMAMYSQNLTSGNAVASSWGGSIDMSTMPPEAYDVVAQNVMYTRTFLAANPNVIQSDGSINMGSATGNLSVPQDISSVLAASSSSASASGSSAPGSGSASSSTTAPTSTPANGASSLTVSMTLSGVVALGAAFLAL